MLTRIDTYESFKSSFDHEIKNTTNSFIKIGYLLKVARDSDILAESQYNTIAEFAKAEYGLTKDVVSRFININDRFSHRGYSDCIDNKYGKFGVAKLGEMLTLSDSIVEVIPDTSTRSEIQTIKKEVKEELKEESEEQLPPQGGEESKVYQWIYNYLKSNKEVYVRAQQIYKKKTEEALMDVLIPSTVGVLFARIPGIGKVMASFDGMDHDVSFVEIRTDANYTSSLDNLLYEAMKIVPVYDAKEEYGETFGEPFDESKIEEGKVDAVVEEVVGETVEEIVDAAEVEVVTSTTEETIELETLMEQVEQEELVILPQETKTLEEFVQEIELEEVEEVVEEVAPVQLIVEDACCENLIKIADRIKYYAENKKFDLVTIQVNCLKVCLKEFYDSMKNVQIAGQMSLDEMQGDVELNMQQQ